MSDIDEIVARMRDALGDPNELVWSEAELIAGIRQAYEDLLNYSGQVWVLEGLDGEPNPTNFSRHYFSLIIRGALGYALIVRSAEQLGAFHFDQAATRAALQAGQAYLASFEKALQGLQSYRLNELQTSANPPYPDGSDETQPGWNSC